MMNQQTLVAVYSTAAHADAAVSDLKAANVPADAISQHAKTNTASHGSAAPTNGQSFWSKMFGSEADHDASAYDRNIASGGSVVTVQVPEEHFDRVSAILEKHNPVDLDEHNGEHGASNQTTTTRTHDAPALDARGPAATGDRMHLSEENLSVGKRAVQGGTTRIRKYVVTTPVEEQVSLHSEKVTADRRPVTDGRPVGDFSFRDQTIEMTEHGEEAVVSKTARVKEEIGLRREGSDRTETVKDNVRREEAEVEQGTNRTETGRASAPVTTAPAQRSDKI